MNATAHALLRAAERYGIDASAADWRGLLLDIWAAVEGAGTAMLLRRNADGIERWLGRLGATPVIAVYDPTQARILTVLPGDSHCLTPRGAQRIWRSRRPDTGPTRTRDLAGEEWA